MTREKLHKQYINWRSRFTLKLALFHFALVLVFDILAIFVPGLMASSIGGGSVFSVGLVYALAIVLSVICATFYYSHRINQEELRLKDQGE